MRSTLLALLCTITVVAYIQRLALSAPTKIIEGELGLGPEGMGVVMAVWYWGYALAQLPAGWLADRLGSKPALVLFAVAWSVLTALTGLATQFPGLVVLWGLMGCAQAGIFPCCTKAIGATFPRTEQAFASGALAASMALGAAVAQWLTAQLLGALSWQQILAWYAVPGLVWAVAFTLAVPRPEASALVRFTEKRSDDRAIAESAGDIGPVRWSKLVTDWQMQLLNGQQFLRAAAVAFFYTWFPRYLKETRDLTEQEAGELAFWPPLAAMFGGFLGGVLSDWVLRRTGSYRLARQGMACVTMVICATVAFGAYLVTDTALAVILLCVGAFCGMACGVSGYAVAIAYGGRQVAVVFATMNMSGNVGAGLFPFVVGWLVAITGNWDLALLVFAGLFAADAVCWALLNPKGTLFGDSERPDTKFG
jgi:sugar phosphate permease